MLLSTEGALRVSIDCYDTAWFEHLKFEISIVWHHIESNTFSAPEQGVIATTEGDDDEEQLFASEVARGPEDDLQCD